jgi:hypothetical protein
MNRDVLIEGPEITIRPWALVVSSVVSDVPPTRSLPG